MHEVEDSYCQYDDESKGSSAFNPTPLPQESEMKELLENRPGDQIYQSVKAHIDTVRNGSKDFQAKFLSIILKDMYIDLALTSAVDDAGATAEYLAQELDIDKPQFKGDQLLQDFSRLSKFKTSLEIARLLGMNEDEIAIVMQEEAERMWVGNRQKQPNVLSLPDEVIAVLRGLTKLSRGAKSNERKPA